MFFIFPFFSFSFFFGVDFPLFFFFSFCLFSFFSVVRVDAKTRNIKKPKSSNCKNDDFPSWKFDVGASVDRGLGMDQSRATPLSCSSFVHVLFIFTVSEFNI